MSGCQAVQSFPNRPGESLLSAHQALSECSDFEKWRKFLGVTISFTEDANQLSMCEHKEETLHTGKSE